MQEFLRKYKIIDALTLDLPVDKNDFIRRLRQHVEPGGAGLLGDPFEVFSSKNKEFRGEVSKDGFKIRKRRKLFEAYAGLAKAEGTFREDKGKLSISTTINGFNSIFIIYYLIVTVLYLGFLVAFFLVDEIPLLVFPFLLLHAALMYGIPFFVMRRSVQRMKRDLEREFFYLTKE